MKVIAIIPARGGSKGIPRKNLRPIAGKPMIYYSIQACLDTPEIDRVVVSTDDEEIAMISQRFGAEVQMRPDELGQDITTLDPVIKYVIDTLNNKGDEFDIIITIQPTAPLLKGHDISEAIKLFTPGVDTVLSVVDDRHLCWTIKDEKPAPVYAARVNRQQLPPNFKENGAIIACTSKQMKTGERFGKNVALMEMPQTRSFDIDHLSDLLLCESIILHKKILFVVIGKKDTGLGHVYRSLLLANELVKYEIAFLCDNSQDLAIKKIQEYNYPVFKASENEIIDKIIEIDPDVVINDILDTKVDYIEKLKSLNMKVINFEDMGPGCQKANLVINALYEGKNSEKILNGPDWFCLRDEFLYLPSPIKNNSILITFGGIDEGNLTCQALRETADYCIENDIKINIITGPGFIHSAELAELVVKLNSSLIKVIEETKRISDYMAESLIAITSAGRTVFELASIKVPMIVICQNDRECTHTFADKVNGIINLGHRKALNDGLILENLKTLYESEDLQNEMISRQDRLDLKNGKKRVIDEIEKVLKG